MIQYVLTKADRGAVSWIIAVGIATAKQTLFSVYKKKFEAQFLCVKLLGYPDSDAFTSQGRFLPASLPCAQRVRWYKQPCPPG